LGVVESTVFATEVNGGCVFSRKHVESLWPCGR